jgi:hypothetical protein
MNPIANPAHILPVNGIPKLVIANEEAVEAAVWPSTLLPVICITVFETDVIKPSDICCSLFQFMI